MNDLNVNFTIYDSSLNCLESQICFYLLYINAILQMQKNIINASETHLI